MSRLRVEVAIQRKALSSIDLFQDVRRQRNATDLGEHGGYFNLPNRRNTHFCTNVGDIRFEANGATEGLRLNETENVGQRLNRSVKGVFQQVLFGPDELVLPDTGRDGLC